MLEVPTPLDAAIESVLVLDSRRFVQVDIIEQ